MSDADENMSIEEEDMEFVDISDSEDEIVNNETDEEAKTYFPGDKIEDGEELVCDQTSYMLYHAAGTGIY